MNSLMCTMHSIREMFNAKLQEFDAEANAHMVWLDEIQQEAFRMFSSDFNAEPELMPKTPSQKRTTRQKRVSIGRVDNRGKRRFSRGTRSNLRRSSARVVLTLGLITEDVQASGSGVPPDEETERPAQLPASSTSLLPVATVVVSAAERHSADLLAAAGSPGHVASKTVSTAVQESTSLMVPRRSSARRVSVRCSLSGLRHSMTQESLRRASRRSILKKKAALNSSSVEVGLEAKGDDAEEQMDGVLTEEPLETVEVAEPEAKVVEEQDVRRFTRSMARTSTPTGPPAPSSVTESTRMPGSGYSGKEPPATISSLSTKNLCPSTKDLASPQKKPSPPIKSQSVIRPNMKSFLHTVAKNQMLMSTPGSLGRNAVKSFIKHTTPLRVDLKPTFGLVERERLRLEALKKKQEQEMERREKMAEEKKRKLEEMKRKRDERLRRVVEARVKEEQKEEEKKKKIEQKLAHMEEKNEKMRVERMAEEKAKKKVASKRQEELELRRKQQEEEAARKKMQQEEERRQRELQAKQQAEEEERARKLAEARRAQELQKELELEREREKERLRQQQAAERERIEREKAEAQRREQELAAREKENKEAEERRLKQTLLKTPVGKCAILNVTVEASPQSYEITPKGGNKAVVNSNPDDYGMDQNSDDSTDDESAPRKPIPSWAEGRQLQQVLLQQYFNPPDVDTYFGDTEEPHLEKIFYKSKPRYFKRTSSAVWNSPPRSGAIGL